MASEHDLILRDGLEAALARTNDARVRANLRIAADILVQEVENPQAMAYLHSILCTIYLPHRRTDPEEIWQRSNGDGATLMIQPTRDEEGRCYGVPYGSTGRLMMIYLQNEAYRNRSRRVELGRSMHAWLRAMGCDSSGKGYKAAKEQALRIERSLVSVSYTGLNGKERWQDTIIRGSFNLCHDRESDQFPQLVELSESFYDALLRHPAVLFEPAIRHLAGKSLALDIYVWLAYRLHALHKPTLVSWRALHSAFGPNYGRERDFRLKFKESLEAALLVYPQAELDVEERGLLLRPSAPPGPPRSVIYLQRQRRLERQQQRFADQRQHRLDLP
ncbi:replication protein RepA [Benzoatithermus flavus]|uniref:Replication protein RepA n=1 Tax=Benzoatithermus flavus TaxID=3108223 RepID=A0ABU8XSD8_9PROT